MSSSHRLCSSLILAASLLAVAMAFDDEFVTYTSVIKLQNVQDAGSRLHSHEVKYGSGSGQQSVTAVKNSDDVNSHWQIMPALKESVARGEPVKCGGKLRLKHLQTGCFLHSHNFQAPLSKGNQEVSCFGDDSHSDTGDNWELICSNDEWLESDSVRLRHVDTGAYLALSGQQFGRPIAGQREVVGMSNGNAGGATWKTAEGVYMSKRKDVNGL